MKKVCFICSSGGHLTELLPVGKRIGRKHRHFWITFRSEMTEQTLKGERYYMVKDPVHNPLSFIRLFIQSLLLFLRERPGIVVTSGAGMAISFSIISKIFGSKLVFIESFCRTQSPSWSARILYRFADRFFVQWEANLEHFGKKAEFLGPVY